MELRTRSFWTEVFAEFLATLLFLFMACGTVLQWNNSPPSVIHIAFSHGLSIATLAMAVLHISGGQLNPAVTISMMAVRRVSVLKALFFIVVQCGGGKDSLFKKIYIRTLECNCRYGSNRFLKRSNFPEIRNILLLK